jgi:hypothetical protein
VDLARPESVDRSTLRWLRTVEKPMAFSLAAGPTPVARLTWSREAGSLATAETASTTWTLKRVGFLNPQVTVRASGSTANVAHVTTLLSYHRVEIANRGAFRFRRKGLLVPAWAVTTDDGQEILHIEPVREGRSLTAGAVLVDPAGRDAPDLLLLAAVSWYFIVLAWFEDEALLPFEGSDASAGSPPTTRGEGPPPS